MDDIIAEYKAFALITNRSTVIGGPHGEIEDDDPLTNLTSENFPDHLMQAGFVIPLPNLVGISATQKLNGVGDATIDVFHPYREGDFAQEFTVRSSQGGSELDTVSLPFMREEPRNYKEFGDDVDEDGNPVLELEDMYGNFDGMTDLLLTWCADNKNWKDIIKKRADILTKAGLGGQLLGALGIGDGSSHDTREKYLDDYVGFKYVVNLEDMTPVWILGRVRENINDPALKKIQEYIRSSAKANEGFSAEEKEKYGQMWVFAFHGYISRITETWSPNGVGLKLRCKSFLEYLNRMELLSSYRIVSWMASPQDKLIEHLSASSNAFSNHLKDWWSNKSVHEVMSYIPTIANATHTYRGMKQYGADTSKDTSEAKFGNYFHYDHFFLPAKDEAKGILDPSNEEIVYDNIAQLTKMLTAYRGSYFNITHPRLAEDVHWMSQDKRSLEELATRWWFADGDDAKAKAGGGSHNPDSDLDYNSCMRNRWKARVYIDPYIANVNLFNSMIKASYKLEDTGATKTALRVLDDFRARIFADYFADGRGNLIFISKRWDDIPRLPSVQQATQGGFDLTNGWSPLDEVARMVNDDTIFPLYEAPVPSSDSQEESENADPPSDQLIGAVFGDHNERYIIDDVLHSWEFTFNEGDIKTHAVITGTVSWIQFNELIQLIGNTAHATLDGGLFSYTVLKYGDRRLTADIQNAEGLFGETFIARPAVEGSEEPENVSDAYQTAFMVGLMRESLARANTGSVKLGHRPDLQLGRTLYTTDRQKKGYPDSIRLDWREESRSSTTVSMIGMADVSQIWGNPMLEAWAIQGFEELIVATTKKKSEGYEGIKEIGGEVIAVPNGANRKATLDELDGDLNGIPHVDDVFGSSPPDFSTKCVPQLEDAVRTWVASIDRKMDAAGSTKDWNIRLTSVYRRPGLTAGSGEYRDENGAGDSKDPRGHWSGNCFDMDVGQTIGTMVEAGIISGSDAEGFLFGPSLSVNGSTTIERNLLNSHGEEHHITLTVGNAVTWKWIDQEGDEITGNEEGGG